MLYLGADKHGFRAIQFVREILESGGLEFADLGVQQPGQDIALEQLIPKIVQMTLKDKKNRAILSCGTGVGVEVGANKFSGIRACLANDERVAKYSRIYDDCNVLCLVGWDADRAHIEKIVQAWLNSEYDGSEKRIRMFEVFNSWHDANNLNQ